MELAYGLGAVALVLILIKLAKLVTRFKNKKILVFFYFVIVVFSAWVHFRIFMYSEFIGISLQESLVVDIASLIFFLFTCIVPITVLRKKIIERVQE